MRIIKKADPAHETEIECHYCKSILAYTWMDVEYRDTLVSMESYITCPVCGRSVVTGYYRTDYGQTQNAMDKNFYYTLDCDANAEAR